MKKSLFYLVCVLLLTSRSVAQTYSPVSVTGFNWDAVAESVPAASSTTGAIDRTNHVMYNVNYASAVGSAQGLPASGTITSGTRTYQLQPYTANNTVFLTGGQTDSLVLNTPAAFTYISLLCFATETQSTNTITLRFTDGTITTYTGVAIKDWFSGTPYILSGFDRTSAATDQPDFNNTNPRMYALDYTLSCANQLKLLRSIVINNTSSGFPRTCVMALSGVAAPTFTFSNTNPTCPTSNNGQATVNASGGAGGFTYTWSISPAQTSSTATSLLPGIYTVSVVSGGCTYPENDTLIASGNAAPITVTASPDSICPGGSSTLTVNGAVSFMWSGGTPSGNTDVVSPLSTATYSVTATNSGGCTGTATVTVTVNPIPPTPTITAGGPTTFCQGGSVVLTSSAATGNTWSTGAITPSITVPSSGSITVTQTLLGCTSPPSAPVTVTVNPIPPAPTISGSPLTFCQGDSVILTSSAPSGNVWSDGSTNVSDTVRASGTFTVTQTVSGCTSAASAPVTVTVNPIPAAPTISGSPLTFCQGDSVILTSSASSGNVWSDGSTQVSDTIRASGTFTVTQTQLGCTSLPSAPVTVTVNPIPPAPTISGAPLTICQGDSVILTSSAPSGNLWSDGSTNASDTIRNSGIFTVTQTVLGCASLPSAQVTVTVNPIPPAPTITASGPTAICSGTSVTLTSSAASGNVWSTSATTQAITASTAGNYTVTQTVLGCTSPPSVPTTVSIIPLPQVNIIPSAPDVCPGSPVTLTANPAGASAYVWDDASTLSTLSIDTAGTYSVSVTVNGCIGSGSIVMVSKPLLGPLTLPDSSSICSGDSVTIDATTLNATSYQWSPTNDTSPTVNLKAEGSYTVTVSNSCGTATASTSVIVKNCDCNIYMPDAFTPNGDGKNDSIGVLYDCPNVKYVKLAIFNRWGETVYESTDINGRWNGTYKGMQAPAGVYVYFADFTGAVNTTEHSYHLRGSLTLIR